jgi:hypothetical protein
MIKKYDQYIKELSGTEWIGSVGPAFGETEIPNTLDNGDTSIIEVDGVFYTNDDYLDLYQNHLKRGGIPLFGFNKENLIKVLY